MCVYILSNINYKTNRGEAMLDSYISSDMYHIFLEAYDYDHTHETYIPVIINNFRAIIFQ